MPREKPWSDRNLKVAPIVPTKERDLRFAAGYGEMDKLNKLCPTVETRRT
tara:strand:- start:851 stop:1000 length:150 start_codon:yes stop_codon:yes gene_type:complete